MSDINMESNYRGFDIRWIDFLRTFEIREGNASVKSNVRTLEECQDWIDKRLKIKYNRVDVIYKGWRGELRKGVATSLIEDHSDYYVWFTDAKKQRSKENIEYIYVDNEHNGKLISTIRENRLQVAKLDKVKVELESQLENLTPLMMIIEKKT